MAKQIYDRVLDGKKLDTKTFTETPPKITPNKGKWLKRKIVNPDIDPLTQKKRMVPRYTATLSIQEWIVSDLTEEEISKNQSFKAIQGAQNEINRLEKTIDERWKWSAAIGDAFAIERIQEVEVLLDVQRAIKKENTPVQE